MEISRGTGLDYRKTSLNRHYLEDGIRGKITEQFPEKLDVL